MSHRVGQQAGAYRLIRLLGEGSFGEVYLGEHISDKTYAAVKVLKSKLSSEDLKQFINEARVNFRLKHPNIIQLLDFGIGAEDSLFLVMDYAPNGTLRQRHPKGTILPLTTIMDYARQITAALQYAHNQRRIHRDIKPENILLGRNSEILLSDFGIAIVIQSTYMGEQNVAGTIPYMAPEQLQGRPQPASDQYALGIIIYEWLCGTLPFHGSPTEVAMQHLMVSPPSLREKVPSIPPDVEQVVMKALAKDPQERFASVQDFATALEKASIPSRSIFLFGYETGGGKQSVLWSNPHLFSLDEAYQLWSKTKRSFTKEEILHGLWVKVGDHRYSFIVHFLPDGSLTESPLFEPDRQLQGSWKLVDGVIRMNIGQYENETFVQYELDIFATRESTMHSGIEFMQDRQTPHSYFKVLHVQSFNKNQWNGNVDFELVMSLLKYRYLDVYQYLDEVRSRLGSSTTPEFEATPSQQGTTGWVQRFAGGLNDPQEASVYRSKYGTYPTWGEIGCCYERLGGTSGRLGFPTSPELQAIPSPQGTTGQVQRFEDNASVYGSGYGAYPTWGGIGRCYENLGGTSGPLGFPTSSELEAIPSPQGTTGWVQRFEGGDIYWYWDGEYDGVPVREPILTIFEKSGGSSGKFGFPKSPAVPDSIHSDHYIQEFEGGVIRGFYEATTQ